MRPLLQIPITYKWTCPTCAAVVEVSERARLPGKCAACGTHRPEPKPQPIRKGATR